MPKIIFINRYYAPDSSATSQLLTSLAEFLVTKNLNIQVVTSKQLYENSSSQLISNEVINGVAVHRLFSTKFGRHNLFGRFIDYFTFYVSTFFFLLLNTKEADMVVAKTDPPLVSVIAAIIIKAKRAKLINWVQDLFPEVANVLSPNMLPKPAFLFIQKLRNWSLKSACKNIVIGEIMHQKLLENGIDDTSIEVINNWHVGSEKEYEIKDIELLKHKWGLDRKFVIGYSGNLGRAHEYKIFADAAERLGQIEDLVFLFVGSGSNMTKLKELVRNREIKNFIFKPYQPLSKLNATLHLADIHLISLNPELEGLIVPSKFYGILAVKKPIIFIGSSEGEVARNINKDQNGLHVSYGDSDDLADKIRELKSKVSRGEFADKNINHSPSISLDKWLQVITRL